jgi:type IV pilus assembly protein PilW
MKPSRHAMRHTHNPSRSRHGGMTMIELLVAMIIGVGVVLAVSTLLVAGENHKRTTTSTNDADQAGAYTFHALDKALRGAGSAIVESTLAYPSGAGLLGCRLNAASILPSQTAFPAPFATAFLGGAPSNLRVAPVLIGKNQSDSTASDVIVVMSGSGASGGMSRAIAGAGSSTSLVLQGTTGIFANDLVLVSQPTVTDCMIEEVNNVSGATLNVSGTPYYNAATAATTLAALSSSTAAFVTPLGNLGTVANPAVNNVQFTLFGVGTNYTLYSYDLLQYQYLVLGSGTKTSEAITDGVVQMNAIYGIQGTTPGVLSTWADPGASGYDINTVMTNPAIQESIIAVRVALVVRGEYYDKNVVSPASVTIFSGYTNAAGNSLQQTVNLAAIPGGQNYRYRVFEFTVPLRNLLLLAGA